MGYDTEYTFVCENPAIIDNFRATCEHAKFAFNAEGIANDGSTWYDHEEDLIQLSMKYPNDLIELHGRGERAEDQWRKYFMYGKMQECKARIEFDPFDPLKLE